MVEFWLVSVDFYGFDWILLEFCEEFGWCLLVFVEFWLSFGWDYAGLCSAFGGFGLVFLRF